MSETRLGSGLEKIRSRHRLTWEVVLIGTGLALLVNSLSTCFFTAIDPLCANRSFWWYLTALLALLLAGAIAGATFYLLTKKETEQSGLTLVLPIHVDPKEATVEILHHDEYAPALHGRELLLRTRDADRKIFVNAWPGPNPLNKSGFGPGHPCWETISQLVQALLVVLLQKYGERSLTGSAHHKGEFRRFAGEIPFTALRRKDWPAALQSNIFLKGRGLDNLVLPGNARLSIVCPESPPGKTVGRRELRVATPQCLLSFSVSPYWSILSRAGSGKAVAEFAPPAVSQTCFLTIPIELRLMVKGTYLSARGISLQYDWFQRLIDNARRRMSWGRFLAGEGETRHDR